MVKSALDVGGVGFVLFLPVAAPDDDDAGFDLGSEIVDRGRRRVR